ncbi:MAG: DNA internalization-related competence protein ComEC/Rec2 [Desulfuromonas sp.]|nr:DNA internalization-related competence protein ComEC/Rec2 [Desulfuromonas sp.]
MAPYWILAAYAAGIGLSAYALPPFGNWPVIVAALLAMLWFPLRHGFWARPLLAAALALAGFLWAQQALEPPHYASHVSRFVTTEMVAVEGVVQQSERLWDGSSRLDVAVERVGAGSTAAHADGLVRLTVREGDPGVAPGDRICWRAKLRRPQLFGTPGEFNYPRHLAARGIYVTSSIGRGTDLARIATPEPDGQLCERLRNAIAARIAKAVSGDTAGLVQTLIVGIGGGISPECRKLLSDGGLPHLFSISGLHFGMLAMLAYAGAHWLYSRSERLLLLCPPRRILPLLLLLPLFFYLLLSGNAAPTKRSFGSIALAALLFSNHRRTPPLALLSTVAIGLLLLSPLSLFEPSFQLSFAGVAGLMIWVPRWQKYLDTYPPLVRGGALMLLTTVAASLATAPLVLWHFHQVAPAGLLANLPAIPLVTWGAVPAGLAGALLLPISPWLADLCFGIAGQVVALTLVITKWCLALPGMQAIFLPITWLEGIGVLLLVGALLPLPSRRQQLALLGLALLLLIMPAPTGSRLRVIALSVGQGDATLLSLAGRHYLIDGGGLTGSTIDIGERLVAPALGRLGARRLAGVILTHDHPDHSAGLPFVLKHLSVDGFWSAIPMEKLEPHIVESLIRRRIPVHTLPEGWTTLGAGSGTALDLFVPPQDADDPNDRSIVVHTAAGGEGVLLPGDLAVKGFDRLCATGLPEPVTLLKLPHHGSRGSRPERFLDRLKPGMAFVSAGRDNPYRLPHPASVAACRDRRIPLYRTDYQGTLTITSDGGPWQARCFTGVSH